MILILPAIDLQDGHCVRLVQGAPGTEKIYSDDPVKMAKLVKIQTYHSKRFARFVDKLAKMPDGDGSMLDHSILFYGSNMSNSNNHDHFPLPSSIVGGGCGIYEGSVVPIKYILISATSPESP